MNILNKSKQYKPFSGLGKAANSRMSPGKPQCIA
jgi:hypothetical protein